MTEPCPRCKDWRPGIVATPYGSLIQCAMCKGKGVVEKKKSQNLETPDNGDDK